MAEKKEPIVSWLDKDFAPRAALKFSSAADSYKPIIAGNTSVDEVVYISNNFTKGTTVTDACFDMTNCIVVSKDRAGTMTLPTVLEKWIGVKCLSANQSTFTSIGANAVEGGDPVEVTCIIGAAGQTAGTISGAVNDGASEKSTANYAHLLVHATPAFETKAKAGKNESLLRVVYTFGEVI